MNHDGQTIIACSSGGQVNAAIAVIRLSGPFTLSQFQSFFSSDLTRVSPRQMVFAKLLDGSNPVDEICFCFFKAPSSYTGENLLELYVHGNVLNIQRVIGLFTRLSFVREAKPGEFSLRALQNKKLTLSQVEGVDLLLNASTPLALNQGLGLLHGELHAAYVRVLELFKQHKASLELLLDFHEDVGEEEAWKSLRQSWSELAHDLASLARRVSPHSSRLLRPELVLAGLPNAGKSTFFNALLSEERAIVSPQAGTTRDYLSEDVSLGGLVFRLVDTAGVRQTENEVESEGIRRSLERIARGFFSILLINPFETNSLELAQLAQHPFDLIFFTHADLPGFAEAKQSLRLVLSGQDVSLTDDNFLLYQLVESGVIAKYQRLAEAQPILLERHKALILHSKSLAERYGSIINIEKDLAIISHELNGLGHCLQELLGIVSPDVVLDHIFANFCIGK